MLLDLCGERIVFGFYHISKHVKGNILKKRGFYGLSSLMHIIKCEYRLMNVPHTVSEMSKK